MKEFEKQQAALTPLMKQYYSIKAKYPDALLLFRVGDFYETFEEDAVKTAQTLGIVLTRRANGAASYVQLAGFPYHALDTYLPKLVKAGFRVAICEQLEDPKTAKTIVKRGVTELISPGVAFHEQVLDQKQNNFVCGIYAGKNICGIAFLDVTTGDFSCTEAPFEQCEKLLHTYQPNEIIVPRQRQHWYAEQIDKNFYLYGVDDWVFQREYAYEILTNQFGTTSLKGFGLEETEHAYIAAAAVFHYARQLQNNQLDHIKGITRIHLEQFLWMDQFTIRNLELTYSLNPNAKTLLQVLDTTITPMGARLLKRWLLMPLIDLKKIAFRHNIVDYFTKNPELSIQIQELLKGIGDIERLISRVVVQKTNPRELSQLSSSLKKVESLKHLLQNTEQSEIQLLTNELEPCFELTERIAQTLVPDAPASIAKSGFIASNVSEELDTLRNIVYQNKDYLANLQQREILRTGIPSLKVGFNNVFGYYLEVTNVHKHKVPSDWIRKQTLANAERYVTPELKEYEEKILGAEEKILTLEQEIFRELIQHTASYAQTILNNGHIIAQIDCLLQFAQQARDRNYCRPVMHSGDSLYIKDGRHPVIEQFLPVDKPYVPNTIYLDNNTQQIIILTGPNMSGKSALLRQTALICIMAQMGSFVPATEAKLCVLDKIFSRVGASDNITTGESTFMVEMNETANILHNITNNSLVLLDEIGRGTSTYDGISIAWAITEYIHEHPEARAKTLFATHYHELNELANYLPRCKNFHVAVKEYDGKVIFLYKLEPGGTEHSFGIHVAKMAGIPDQVIRRATEILHELEKKIATEEVLPHHKNISAGIQLSFVQLDDPLLIQIKEELLKLDINTLTPVEALMKLNEIKNLLMRKKK